MLVSVDGARKNLVNAFDDLTKYVNKCNSDHDENNHFLVLRKDEFANLHSEVKMFIGFMLCIYSNDEPEFTNMSDIDLLDLNFEEED